MTSSSKTKNDSPEAKRIKKALKALAGWRIEGLSLRHIMDELRLLDMSMRVFEDTLRRSRCFRYSKKPGQSFVALVE